MLKTSTNEGWGEGEGGRGWNDRTLFSLDPSLQGACDRCFESWHSIVSTWDIQCECRVSEFLTLS